MVWTGVLGDFVLCDCRVSTVGAHVDLMSSGQVVALNQMVSSSLRVYKFAEFGVLRNRMKIDEAATCSAKNVSILKFVLSETVLSGLGLNKFI